MKDNKTVTLILICIVIGIWAKVFFKISNNAQVVNESLDSPLSTIAVNQINTIDDFDLMFEGRDPFLGRLFKSVKEKDRNLFNKKEQKKELLPKAFEWPKIEYFGFVKSTKNRDELAIIKTDGFILNIREGDEFYNGFILKNVYRDSILIRINKNQKTFHKQ